MCHITRLGGAGVPPSGASTMATRIEEHELWHHLSVPEVLRLAETSPQGLVGEEVNRRLKKFGRNELPAPRRTTSLKLFLRQFASALIVVLLVAAVVSLSLGEPLDALVILAAVVINVIVGFTQERKAEGALAALRRFVQYQVKVVRGDTEATIPVEELVPGDVIRLKAGDRVPADARLIQAYEVETNEAPLTGESQAIVKDSMELPAGTVLAERMNMLYLGTALTRGDATAAVVATGLNTEFGQIAELLRDVHEDPTPLQVRLERLGQGVGLVVAITCMAIFLFGIALGHPFREMFSTAVAIAVSAVPEGLVVVVTAILALGMHRILRRHALVRKLVAAETLGSTTVICCDKTGTLTSGEMQVARVVTPDEELEPARMKLEDGSSSLALLKIGALSSDAYVENPNNEFADWVVVGNPTERALVLAGQQVGIDVAALRRDFPRLDTVPFSSDRKYMVTLHELPGGERAAYLKGAPERVLAACASVHTLGRTHKLSDDDRRKFLRESDKMSRQGLRLLAFASRSLPRAAANLADVVQPEPSEFTFLGFIGIKDPLRPEVNATVRAAWSAGIRIIMITGDHRLTAQAIAEEVGLPAQAENILDGEKLQQMTDEELKSRVTSISVYARTTPHDKLRIIDAWQSRGEVVAMTGDGVNDAPALKSADIGVALGSGSDVSKEAADLVLLDNNLATIVAAVEEGRTIYNNIRKVVLYLMSDSFAEMVLILGAFIIGFATGEGLPLPILATQILWVNLVSDSFPAVALAADPMSPDTMEQPPLPRRAPILDGQRKLLVGLMSLIKGGGALVAFLFLLSIEVELDHARTVVFTMMALSSLAYVFSCKHLERSLLHPRTWNNRKLAFAVAAGFVLQLLVIYLPSLQRLFHTVPLTVGDWVLVASFCGLIVFAFELTKLVAARRLRVQAAG